MDTNILGTVKLESSVVESIVEKLRSLTEHNSTLPQKAYAEHRGGRDECGCKGSCDGGCTSW